MAGRKIVEADSEGVFEDVTQRLGTALARIASFAPVNSEGAARWNRASRPTGRRSALRAQGREWEPHVSERLECIHINATA